MLILQEFVSDPRDCIIGHLAGTGFTIQDFGSPGRYDRNGRESASGAVGAAWDAFRRMGSKLQDAKRVLNPMATIRPCIGVKGVIFTPRS
jgi:hypothetical protein